VDLHKSEMMTKDGGMKGNCSIFILLLGAAFIDDKVLNCKYNDLNCIELNVLK